MRSKWCLTDDAICVENKVVEILRDNTYVGTVMILRNKIVSCSFFKNMEVFHLINIFSRSSQLSIFLSIVSNYFEDNICLH